MDFRVMHRMSGARITALLLASTLLHDCGQRFSVACDAIWLLLWKEHRVQHPFACLVRGCARSSHDPAVSVYSCGRLTRSPHDPCASEWSCEWLVAGLSLREPEVELAALAIASTVADT